MSINPSIQDAAVRKAAMIIVVHSLLLFFFGTILSLNFMMVPLWISSLLVLIWVPRLYFRIWKGFLRSEIPHDQRKKYIKSILILTVLVIPYLVPPGFLLSYPVSDLGFRVILGNKLQQCVTEFLRKPDNQIKQKPRNLSSFVDLAILPHCVRVPSFMRVAFATVGGRSRKDRHLSIIYGGGFGHWGLVIGSQDFRAESKSASIRQMWPGVYAFRELD